MSPATAVSPEFDIPTIAVSAIAPWRCSSLSSPPSSFFVSAEQGALAVFTGNGVHEWVHDGRHLLGFPCH